MITEKRSSGFSILRLVTDQTRGITVPIGAVAWDSSRQWYQIRTLAPTERVEGVTRQRRAFVHVTKRQLERWAEQGHVPYAEQPAPPWTDEFWLNAGAILTTAVRLDPPKPMEPLDENGDELELLFDALVQPQRRRREQRQRIDGAVRRALGDELAKRTRTQASVRAYHQAMEQVLRAARGPGGLVVIEAVNLAARDARKEADALASKLMRIGAQNDQLKAIVGYLASPGGLNGEGHMRDWIAERATPAIFDLNAERDAFRRAAQDMLLSIGEQRQLDLPPDER